MNVTKKAIKKGTALIISISFLLGLTTISPGQTASAESRVDPGAVTVLKRMTDYLGNLEKFSVTTENTLEDLLRSGHRIDLDVTSDVVINRPNNLLAERKGEIVNQRFFYDGKNLTLYNPLENAYATASVPDTYLKLFRYMATSFGFAVPISDLVLKDSFSLLMEEVNLAVFIGKKSIDGNMCDHLLFSRPGVDFQLWVESGDTPLPRKYVVTDTSTADRLSIRTRLSNWNLEPIVKVSDFTFIPPKGAQKIEFLPF